ncbi:Putative transcription elongation factor SPT5-like protein 1 [Auxenochlorella protothecoides]|uniref:Putative transcription elongation factor SPT5-like protein 1 n=1 Tax=Auxenochlorella protothecoides TaxID=3075 RepID=A0A087SAH9_AUXPR|nr:Putative transcription elongation factor SPT5-like protein 1 [Auxenochlorella protothecoides]KFM22733.1 Putative transcription elongation factor SPT5-like protein 1 [Auxenochlorella protothecoides]
MVPVKSVCLLIHAQEPEAEEDEEDEEEDGLGRHRSAARKRGKAAAFIDDVADEDDEEDEEASRQQKRSRFIDDIAEVDDDDEDDELEEEGLDDLIDDAGEHVHDAADMIAMRRQMREAEMQAAKDEEMNPEELQAYLKDRYGGQSHYPGTGGAGTEDFGAVAQQALLPKPSDPKLWVVRCAEGAEREVVVCLLQKCYDLAQKGRSLLIKSAFCQDHLKVGVAAVRKPAQPAISPHMQRGYLYVEAVKEAHVAEAVRGMRAVFNSKKPRMVPLGEMTAAVAVQVTAARGVDVGSWVRAKAGLYKGDLAQVVDLDASGARATLRLVPRLDLAALSARRPEDARANFGRAPRVRPAAKAFSPDEARQYKTLDVLTQRDRTTGQLVHVLNGSQRFSEGYLIKSVAVKGLALEDGLPPLDDLQRFQAAAQGGGGGGAGDRAGAADLAGLVQSLTTEGEGQGGAAPTRFAKGDLVLVVQGDLAGIRGRVEAFGEDGLLMVAPTDSKLPGFTELIGLHPREIQKHFESGSHVKVEHGQHMGETGMVVTVTGPIATIFTDVSRQEIRVFVKDLVQAVAVTSSVDTIGGYELHDLVALDATTVGVIVGVERDACRVLTNQGRPEKPDVRVALLPDLKRKLNNRKAGAQDGARNEVAVGDIVEVVDGPLRGKNGTVRYVVRGFLFLQSRQIPDHGGYVCVQARHCRVRGGRKPALTKTPAYDPAWAATPAHPGFAAPSPYHLPGSPGRGPTPGMRYHIDTPGSGHLAPTPGSYLPTPGMAPSPFSPAPALTPGLAATPGLSYEAVLLPGGEARGAVHEVDAAGLLARVAPGRQGDGGAWGYEGAEASVEVPVRDLQAVTPARTDTVKGDGGAWGYEGAEASVEVPVRDLQAVTPARTDTVKLLRGDLAGRVGELVGTDGGDGIVKLGPEIKIWELAHVGRVVLPAA